VLLSGAVLPNSPLAPHTQSPTIFFANKTKEEKADQQLPVLVLLKCLQIYLGRVRGGPVLICTGYSWAVRFCKALNLC